MTKLYIEHADPDWFKGSGWYVIDDNMHFHGPFTKAEAVHENFRLVNAIKNDPWLNDSNI